MQAWKIACVEEFWHYKGTNYLLAASTIIFITFCLQLKNQSRTTCNNGKTPWSLILYLKLISICSLRLIVCTSCKYVVELERACATKIQRPLVFEQKLAGSVLDLALKCFDDQLPPTFCSLATNRSALNNETLSKTSL